MEKIDLKDRKILFHLDCNSRQSFSSIGRKVGLHKDVVAYRVKKLQEKGIIKHYFTNINEYKIGYFFIRFYLTFQYVTPEIKQDIIDFFVKNKYTVTVLSTTGQYDLVVIIAISDVINFYDAWEKVFSKYRDYFAKHIFSIMCKYKLYKLSFLLDEKDSEEIDRIYSKYYYSRDTVKIDEMDTEILKMLASNTRLPTLEIAKKLKSTANTINIRIKNLIKSGVIHGFRISIDYEKIGYNWYKTDLNLRQPDKAFQIIKFIERNPNLWAIIRSLGYVDLELGFILKNENDLHQIIGEISKKFSDTIKNYSYFTITNAHKYQDLTQ